MTITIELPPTVEEAYVAEAKARGVSLDALLQKVLVERQPKPAADLSPEEWTRELRAASQRNVGKGAPSDEAMSRDEIYRERGL